MNDLYVYQLETENKQLKEDIETFKFTIITQQQMIDELIEKLDKTKEFLKNIEYFKETIKDEFGCEYTNEYCFKEYIEEAIEILGDKENEKIE